MTVYLPNPNIRLLPYVDHRLRIHSNVGASMTTKAPKHQSKINKIFKIKNKSIIFYFFYFFIFNIEYIR